MPSFAADTLTAFVTRLFTAVGVPDNESATVARSLVGANLRGHDSHGVMRVPQYVDFLRNEAYRIAVPLKVVSETPAVVVCDGQWGLGQVQAHRLLDLILPRAKVLGLAAGTARDCGHIGRLGEYAERAADEGLVLLATVNNCGAGQRVAPPGGLEPRLGTNPLCAAVPTNTDPVVLDFGTSVVAEGKVRVYHINKKPVPEGWLLDPQGHPTTDPSVLYEKPLGSILPMGGTQAYKGFGLSLVLDMLSGGLSGGRSSHSDAPAAKGNNVVFLALDPNRFSGHDALVRESTQVADYVRNTPRAPGVEAILLPGDPERRTLKQRSAEGVPLEDAHWAKLAELAEQLGVAVPEMPAGTP
ncbi:Ldh family oxidoreductase [Singulisphaera sp. Ch08]|uniref:Ldh family oxidoreductase n=1 Tax=Singulisphaera sp. Ch08 TaxID=3120278 RepID=A0AAU7C6Q8_9BACT